MEELKLRGLMGLVEEIWEGPFSWESFGKLRNLEIKECHNISVAITSSKLQVLHNLEKLTLSSCNSVKVVIQVEVGVVHVSETETLLPRLTKLCLEDLPMLTHLFGFRFGFVFRLRPSILQNTHELEVSSCGNLLNIVPSLMAETLVRLKKLSIIDCPMVEDIVGDDYDNDGHSDGDANEHLVDLKSLSSESNAFELFPYLEEMKVIQLPSLTRLLNKKITGLDHMHLQNLRILQVSYCGSLEIVLTLSMATTLVNLECLSVFGCDKVKGIVENGGGAVENGVIIFTKLEKLELEFLPNLKSFCSASECISRLPCLICMRMREYPEMEYFCMGDSITPMLERVKVDCYP